MGIDPNIEELKGKDVIAMETVEENIVDFHYLENGKVESKRIYGKRPDIFKKYALVCGMVWDGIRKGEGYEPCHDFRNGHLFVPLRGKKGVIHVREDQYKEICIRNGQTFISCKGELEIPACKSHEGNRKKMEEAHEIAVNLGYYPETEMAGKAAACNEKVKPPAVPVSIPFAEPADSYGGRERAKGKKKKPWKKGLLLRDLLDAYPTKREIESGRWEHKEPERQKHFNSRAAQSQKESELKEGLSLFYDMIGEWNGESS